MKTKPYEEDTTVKLTSTELLSEQIKDYGDVNFNWYPGAPILRKALKGYATGSTTDITSIPTVVKVHYSPTIGVYGDDSNSPVNMATAQLQAKLREVNSGATNYSAPDLMIYVLSIASMLVYHSWMVRLLGLLQRYETKDFNVPDEFYAGQDVNYDALVEKRGQLAGYINDFAMRINVLSIPDVFPLVKQQIALVANIYKLDESNNMGQYLFFMPNGLYRYEENESSGVKFGTLQWESFPIINSLDDIKAYGDTITRDILNSEDHMIMRGDILKAFGNNTIKIEAVPKDYKIEPIFDKTLLNQLHNAMIMQGLIVGEITQNGLTDYIYQDIQVGSATAGLYYNIPVICDSVDWDPDARAVSNLVRWKVTFEYNEVEQNYDITACGSEILTGIEIIYKDNNTYQFVDKAFSPFISVSPHAAGSAATITTVRNLFEQMEMRVMIGNTLPFQYGFQNDGAKTFLLGKPRCGTFLSEEQIENLHRVKMNILLGVGKNY